MNKEYYPKDMEYLFEGIFTKEEQEKIKENLSSYLFNFGYLKIEKVEYGSDAYQKLIHFEKNCGNEGGFLIYTDKFRAETGAYTQFCPNVDYLNGWLYGAVQAINLFMEPVPYDVQRRDFKIIF